MSDIIFTIEGKNVLSGDDVIAAAAREVSRVLSNDSRGAEVRVTVSRADEDEARPRRKRK